MAVLHGSIHPDSNIIPYAMNGARICEVSMGYTEIGTWGSKLVWLLGHT